MKRFPASIVDDGGAFLWTDACKGKPYWAARRFADGSWAFALEGELSGRTGVSADEFMDVFAPCYDANTYAKLCQEADAAFASRKPG